MNTEKGHSHHLNIKSVDKLTPTRVRLTIEFSGETVKDHEKQTANRYLQGARIPGFRPGKAPLKMIQERFKNEIRRDVVSHLLEAGLHEALEKTNLTPISQPQIQLEEIADGKPFEFRAEFDIEPEIDLKNYKDIPLKSQKSEPTEEEIQKSLDSLRDRMAILEPVKEGKKAEKGSFVVANIGYRLSDQPDKMQEAKPFTVEVGTDELLPELDKALMAMAPGEKREIKETFPADYGDKDLAGKEAIFDCELLEIKEKILPELNDAFASQLKEGMTLLELRKEISDNIRRSHEEEVQRKQRQEIMDYLIEQNKFEVPQSLIEEQSTSLMNWMAEDLKRRGTTMQNLTQEDKEAVRKRAEHMVKSSLLLKELAKKEDIKLDEQRIQARVDVIASQLNRSVEETKKFLSGKGMWNKLRDEILTDQLFEFLTGHAKISS